MGTATAGLGAGSVDEQFLELICRDEELVDAEFEAIIAAEWPAPPARRHATKVTCGPAVRPAKVPAALPVDGWVRRPWYPGIGGWVRQRSPPDTRKTGKRRSEGR